jgi:cobalt-precorrin 5A hydrolase
MALGIVVRVIAPYLKDKFTDPSVVVVDENSRFAISTLCGHEGGANRLAYLIAGIIDAEPVVTTASETNKRLIVGLGCRRDVTKTEIVAAIKNALKMKAMSMDMVREVAIIKLKAENKQIIAACDELNIPIRVIPIHKIKEFRGSYSESELVKNKIGIGGVCEPCALIAARFAKLILPKTVLGRVTIAIAEESCM